MLLAIGGAVFLMGQPKQMANAVAAGKTDPSLSEELQSEGEKSSPEPERVQEESEAPSSSKEPVPEESLSEKEPESPQASAGPEVNETEPSAQAERQDVWEEELPEEPDYLSPEEYFEKVAAVEAEKLASSLPGAVRTRQDLGSYSNWVLLEAEVDALYEEGFEEAYMDSTMPLKLAEYTQEPFEKYGCGYNTTGQYNWKLLQADSTMGRDGLPEYKIRVQIQTQVDDPAVTVSGVDTLEVVERVRQHLSQWGERVDVLPQQGNGEFLYVALDVEGLAPDIDLYVQSQEDMIAWLCAEVDTCREQRGMTRCRYDFRLVDATEREEYSSIPLSGFTFALYLEAA